LDHEQWYWNGERVVFPIGTSVDGELSREATALVLAAPAINALHGMETVSMPVGMVV